MPALFGAVRAGAPTACHPVALRDAQGGGRPIKRRRPPEGGRRDAGTVPADRGAGVGYQAFLAEITASDTLRGASA